jgi:tetratricopeptide (TPR) repeat protein
LDYQAESVQGGAYVVRGTLTQLVEPFRTPLPLTVDLGGWIYDEWITVDSAQQSFEFRTELEPLSVTIDAGRIVPRIETGDRARVHSELGKRAAAGNLWAEAVNQFGAAVALDPKRALYHAQYGEALVRVGRPSEGLAALHEALDRSPSNADYVFATGRLSGQTGDHQAAVELLERYVRLQPDAPRGHVELAAALVELGKLPAALAHLDRCPPLLNETPDATWLERYHIAVGMYREARGERGLAISAYEAALAVNPVSDEARRRLARLCAH